MTFRAQKRAEGTAPSDTIFLLVSYKTWGRYMLGAIKKFLSNVDWSGQGEVSEEDVEEARKRIEARKANLPRNKTVNVSGTLAMKMAIKRLV
jgi:sRNA-binding protein